HIDERRDGDQKTMDKKRRSPRKGSDSGSESSSDRNKKSKRRHSSSSDSDSRRKRGGTPKRSKSSAVNIKLCSYKSFIAVPGEVRRDRERERERDHSRDRARDRYQSRERERTRNGSRERDRDTRPSRDGETDSRRRGRSPSPEKEPPAAKKKKEELDPILTRTGGAYIPPARLRMMQEQITDKSSLAYQRMSWEALKKSINGLINKVNVSNIGNIINELLQENIIRGRGLLARSVLQAQSASPIFTHVYAAVVAIINSKFPQIGELILKRLILNFRKGYRRNDKAHEVLCLEMLTLLLERPTDDSVEVAISFLKECGLKLTEVSPRGINGKYTEEWQA
ncbi:CWC22 factor, partial [Polypterus senegalus]